MELPPEAFERDDRFGTPADTIAAPNADGLLTVDLFSGDATPSAAGEGFACGADRVLYTPVTPRSPAGDVTYVIGSDVMPCDAHGDPAPEFAAGAAASVGAQLDNGG